MENTTKMFIALKIKFQYILKTFFSNKEILNLYLILGHCHEQDKYQPNEMIL